jgi:hypothetical protein
MSLNSLTPNTIYGWAGLVVMGGAFLYHKSLSSMGLILAIGVGAYLYFVMDDQTATTSS